MAWALRSTGSQYLNIPSTINIPASTTFIIEYEFSYSADFGRPFGRTSTFNSRALHFFSTQEVRLTDDSGNNAVFTAPAHTKTDLNKFRFERDGSNNVDFYLNDVFVSTVSGFSGAFNIQLLWRHNQLSSLTTSGLMTFLSFTIGGTPTNYYSADDSSHAAGTVTLVDTISANNAVGVGFAEDGTVTDWVEFGSSVDVADSTSASKSNSNSDSVLTVGSFDISDSVNQTKSTSNQDSIVFAAAVSIIDSLNTSQSISNNDNVSLVGAVSVSDSINTSKSNSNTDSIQFGATVFVDDSTSSSKSVNNSDSVLLAGEFSIQDSTTNSKSIAGIDLVYLSAAVTVNDSTTTSQSSVNNDSVTFVGEFNVGDSKANSKSNSIGDAIILIGEFVVLDSSVTTKTASNSDSVIIGEIVVSFNSETNYTQPFLSTSYTQSDLTTGYSQPFLSTNYTQ